MPRQWTESCTCEYRTSFLCDAKLKEKKSRKVISQNKDSHTIYGFNALVHV